MRVVGHASHPAMMLKVIAYAYSQNIYSWTYPGLMDTLIIGGTIHIRRCLVL
jgi:hypothetical protein